MNNPEFFLLFYSSNVLCTLPFSTGLLRNQTSQMLADRH
jgi:hypothetical protein